MPILPTVSTWRSSHHVSHRPIGAISTPMTLLRADRAHISSIRTLCNQVPRALATKAYPFSKVALCKSMPQLKASPALNISIRILFSLLSRLSITWVIGIGLLLPIPFPSLLSLWFWGILLVLLILHLLLWLRGLHHGIPITTCGIVRISICGHTTGSGDRLRNSILRMGRIKLCRIHICGIRKCGIRKCCIRSCTLSLSLMEIHGVRKRGGIHIRNFLLVSIMRIQMRWGIHDRLLIGGVLFAAEPHAAPAVLHLTPFPAVIFKELQHIIPEEPPSCPLQFFFPFCVQIVL